MDLAATGRQIVSFRSASGLTQAELAESVGVSHQAVSKWETGSSLPDIEVLMKLAKLFKTTLENLLEPEDIGVGRRPDNLAFEASPRREDYRYGRIPSGTVTFLFTDIEGSTKLWQQFPNDMKSAIRRHDEILANAIQSNQGYVFKTVGDAFCAAFDLPLNALKAAISAQRDLGAETWMAIGDLRVRIGIHSGSADERNGDYYGPTVNRVARLMSAGHGSQILLSSAFVELIRDTLPEGVTLQSLGSHRLKDLMRSEDISQVVALGLDTKFPALMSLDSYPNNLPVYQSNFVGRGKELDQVVGMVDQFRIVTLVGPGGIGKTRTSVHVAASFLDNFADGVWFIDLSSVQSYDQIYDTVASAVGLRDVETLRIDEAVVEFLSRRKTLLIFDNCEQVVEGAANVIERIVEGCPSTKIIASSREPLSIDGEHVYHVHPLSLPPQIADTQLDVLSQYESVGLFIDRSRKHNTNFALDKENAAWIAEICSRLDGLPLALELAAARTNIMSARDIAQKLGSTLNFLTKSSRSSADRHRTIRATLDWSYNLLSEDERHAFRTFAVFAGGWTLDLVSEILEEVDDDEYKLMSLISSLVDKSLVNVASGTDVTRYCYLQTVREYALEKLFAEGEDTNYFVRLLYWANRTVDSFVPALDSPHQQKLEVEIDNVLSAVDWGLSKETESNVAGALGRKLQKYWNTKKKHNEGIFWLKKVLDTTSDTQPTPFAKCNTQKLIGILYHQAGQFIDGRNYIQAAADRMRELGAESGPIERQPMYFDCFVWLSSQALLLDGVDSALTYIKKAQNGFDSISKPSRDVDNSYIGIFRMSGDYRQMRNELRRVRKHRGDDDIWLMGHELFSIESAAKLVPAIHRATEFLTLISNKTDAIEAYEPSVAGQLRSIHETLAFLQRRTGDTSDAQLNEAMKCAESVGSLGTQMWTLFAASQWALYAGDFELARKNLDGVRQIATEYGRGMREESLLSLAQIECAMGSFELAVEHCNELQQLSNSSGDRWVQADIALVRSCLSAHQADLASSEMHNNSALNEFKALGAKARYALALRQIGRIDIAQNKVDQAHSFFDESRTVCNQCGDVFGELESELLLSCSTRNNTKELTRLSSEVFDKTDDVFFLASMMITASEAFEIAGSPAEATSCAKKALSISSACGSPLHQIVSLERIAHLDVEKSEFDHAKTIFIGTDHLRDLRSFPRPDGMLLPVSCVGVSSNYSNHQYSLDIQRIRSNQEVCNENQENVASLDELVDYSLER